MVLENFAISFCIVVVCRSQLRDDIERLLDDDADMSEMYLSRKLAFQGVDEPLGRVESDKQASADYDEERYVT
jgi:hypothetical protein